MRQIHICTTVVNIKQTATLCRYTALIPVIKEVKNYRVTVSYYLTVFRLSNKTKNSFFYMAIWVGAGAKMRGKSEAGVKIK